MSKCRIIINSWDDRSFNQIINRPLAELIETTEETGEFYVFITTIFSHLSEKQKQVIA